MVAAGQIEAGIAQPAIASWAYAGTGIFAAAGPLKNLRAIASLFPESLQLVVRDDSAIQTLADLRGKHISLSQPASGTVADARVGLPAAALTEQEVKPEYLRPAVPATSVQDGPLDSL